MLFWTELLWWFFCGWLITSITHATPLQGLNSLIFPLASVATKVTCQSPNSTSVHPFSAKGSGLSLAHSLVTCVALTMLVPGTSEGWWSTLFHWLAILRNSIFRWPGYSWHQAHYMDIRLSLWPAGHFLYLLLTRNVTLLHALCSSADQMYVCGHPDTHACTSTGYWLISAMQWALISGLWKPLLCCTRQFVDHFCWQKDLWNLLAVGD